MGFFDAIGGIFDSISDSKTAKENIKLQKQFAQTGIQWKVADAKKAGINPVYALGAQTTAFQPVSVGSSLGSSLGHLAESTAMGQDIERSFSAGKNQAGRLGQLAEKGAELDLKTKELNNTLLATQIAKLQAPGTPPPAQTVDQRYLTGLDGQGSAQAGAATTPLLDPNPMPQTASAPGQPHSEPGAINDSGFARTPTGWAPVPSKDVKDRIEDNMISELSWEFRNRIPALFGDTSTAPPIKLPAGHRWSFNGIEWKRMRPANTWYGWEYY